MNIEEVIKPLDLMNQAFPDDGNWSVAHRDFKVEDVTCSQCDKEFDVEVLEW